MTVREGVIARASTNPVVLASMRKKTGRSGLPLVEFSDTTIFCKSARRNLVVMPATQNLAMQCHLLP